MIESGTIGSETGCSSVCHHGTSRRIKCILHMRTKVQIMQLFTNKNPASPLMQYLPAYLSVRTLCLLWINLIPQIAAKHRCLRKAGGPARILKPSWGIHCIAQFVGGSFDQGVIWEVACHCVNFAVSLIQNCNMIVTRSLRVPSICFCITWQKHIWQGFYCWMQARTVCVLIMIDNYLHVLVFSTACRFYFLIF